MQYAAYNTKDVTVVILDSASAPVLIFATPNANANGTIEVTVSVKATTPITATRFRVDAPEGFTLLSAESLLDGSDFTLVVQEDTVLPYNVAIINTAIKEATINAAVIKLTFATDGIEDNSECLVTVTAEETYNLYCEAIDTATVSASVTVTEYKGVIGDIDGDERVTVLDALMLIRAIVNSKTIANGDINGDGKVGLTDVIRIMKLIAQ